MPKNENADYLNLIQDDNEGLPQEHIPEDMMVAYAITHRLPEKTSIAIVMKMLSQLSPEQKINIIQIVANELEKSIERQ